MLSADTVTNKEEGMKLRLTKTAVCILVSVSLLGACSGPKDNRVTEQTSIKSVKKNDAVHLPVPILEDNNYNIEGKIVTFTRSITHVELKDFDESSELELREKYNDYISKNNIKLKKDYKQLIIHMKHEISEKARHDLFKGYVLNTGSGLVIGEDEVASENEFVDYQQRYMTANYRAKSTFEPTGKVALAIPNQYAKNKSLQLKVVQKLNKTNKLVYIDVN